MFFKIVVFLIALSAAFDMFKVSHGDCVHGTALKIVDDDGSESLLWSDRTDFFAPSMEHFALCSGGKCCCAKDLYVVQKEDRAEHDVFTALSLNFKEGVDRWVLYYYLCGDRSRKSLRNEKDVEAFHAFYASVFENVRNFNLFFDWFESLTLEE